MADDVAALASGSRGACVHRDGVAPATPQSMLGTCTTHEKSRRHDGCSDNEHSQHRTERNRHAFGLDDDVHLHILVGKSHTAGSVGGRCARQRTPLPPQGDAAGEPFKPPQWQHAALGARRTDMALIVSAIHPVKRTSRRSMLRNRRPILAIDKRVGRALRRDVTAHARAARARAASGLNVKTTYTDSMRGRLVFSPRATIHAKQGEILINRPRAISAPLRCAAYALHRRTPAGIVVKAETSRFFRPAGAFQLRRALHAEALHVRPLEARARARRARRRRRRRRLALRRCHRPSRAGGAAWRRLLLASSRCDNGAPNSRNR